MKILRCNMTTTAILGMVSGTNNRRAGLQNKNAFWRALLVGNAPWGEQMRTKVQ